MRNPQELVALAHKDGANPAKPIRCPTGPKIAGPVTKPTPLPFTTKRERPCSGSATRTGLCAPRTSKLKACHRCPGDVKDQKRCKLSKDGRCTFSSILHEPLARETVPSPMRPVSYQEDGQCPTCRLRCCRPISAWPQLRLQPTRRRNQTQHPSASNAMSNPHPPNHFSMVAYAKKDHWALQSSWKRVPNPRWWNRLEHTSGDASHESLRQVFTWVICK